MPWLTTEGASHQIADGETIVGSGPHAGWRLVSHDLAARHFVIGHQGGQVTVRASGADGVIAVNGAQSGSKPVVLHDGATIDAGSARFVFSLERPAAYAALSVQPAHLVETRGNVAYPINTQSVGIGRDNLNSVVIRDPTASRFHAEIRREAGGYVLHPHGSSGTLVNGRTVGSPERLGDGDRIEIANVELRFVLGSAPEGSLKAATVEKDESSQRPTVIGAKAMEIPPEEKTTSTKWIWIAAALVIAATIYLAVW